MKILNVTYKIPDLINNETITFMYETNNPNVIEIKCPKNKVNIMVAELADLLIDINRINANDINKVGDSNG